MSERIHELLHRNLQEVFGEGDSARRRGAIQELYTDDCVLYVPPGIFVGHDALDKFAGDLRATHPHFAYVPHGAPQALHNAGRLAWGSGPRGEKPDYTGLSTSRPHDGILHRSERIHGAGNHCERRCNLVVLGSGSIAGLNRDDLRPFRRQRSPSDDRRFSEERRDSGRSLFWRDVHTA